MASIPSGFYKDTHINAFGVVSQSPERASSPNTATPTASTSKMLTCCRKSNTAGVENSAQKTTFCSACNEPLPTLCKKHRYCCTSTSKEKREACDSLKFVAWMLRAPRFKEPCGSEDAQAHCSLLQCAEKEYDQCYKQWCIYSSSHFLSCTPGTNWLKAWKSLFSYLSLQ